MRRQFNSLTRNAQWRYLKSVHRNTSLSNSTGSPDMDIVPDGKYTVYIEEKQHEDCENDQYEMLKYCEMDISENLANSKNIGVEKNRCKAYNNNSKVGETEMHNQAVYGNDKQNTIRNDMNEVSASSQINAYLLHQSNIEEQIESIDYNDLLFQQPIYDGSPISLQESMLSILSLSLKHNLTDTCISDIFTVINHHMKTKSKHLNLYQFQKYFQFKDQTYTKNYYCNNCQSNLSSSQDMCIKCENFDIKYFVTLSITDQLKMILGRNDIQRHLNNRFNRKKQNDLSVEDVYDGSLYNSENVKDFLSNANHFSFTWCSDGVPVFESSRVGAWPFYLRINELPYHDRIRRENTILAGLWFGSGKPSPNIFLSSMKNELQSLYNGVDFKLPETDSLVTLRALCLYGTCDLPAKCLFLNMSQFNGQYGCPCCEQKAQPVRLSSGKVINVYGYEKNVIPRTLNNSLKYAQEAVAKNGIHNRLCNKTNVMGIKGPTVLSLLMPNYIEGTAIDSMHCVFEGVTKKLLCLWFDSEFSASPYSLRRVITEIDDLLLKIRPPNFVHRKPRSLIKFNSWKGSEFKNWLLHYSIPILKDFMRPDYFFHFIQLVTAISILNSDSISQNEIDQSEYLLNKFVKEFASESLYGLRHCSINVHLLIHLPDNVRKFGPLWVHSCFTYEDINGQLVRNIHGTTDLESQISKFHYRILKYSSLINETSLDKSSEFILQKKKQVKVIEPIESECYSVGTYQKLNEIPTEIKCMANINNYTLRKYYRLLKCDLLYVSEDYKTDLKTNSSFAQFHFKQKKCFGKILYFLKLCVCDCEVVCFCSSRHLAVINPVSISTSFITGDTNQQIHMPHIFEYILTSCVITVPVINLITPCYVISYNSNFHISVPLNKVECE